MKKYHLFIRHDYYEGGWDYIGGYETPSDAWNAVLEEEYVEDAQLRIIGEDGALEPVAEDRVIEHFLYGKNEWSDQYHVWRQSGWLWSADESFEVMQEEEELRCGVEVPEWGIVVTESSRGTEPMRILGSVGGTVAYWDRLIHRDNYQPRPFMATGI